MPDMIERLTQTWVDLSAHPDGNRTFTGRRYRRLDIEREYGFRLSVLFPALSWELLVEMEAADDGEEIRFPEWQGMVFDLLTLNVPAEGSKHVSLRLDDHEFRDIFVSICGDLASELVANTKPDQRRKLLTNFLDRWSNFFEKNGRRGLSSERQRGLYGELWWLRRLLIEGMAPSKAIESWKGCERAYHDFEVSGKVLEVKTTLSKEPKRVRISNERQLDDRGLVSLHLLVLSLISSHGGGETLPGIIDELRERLREAPGCSKRFEHCLREAGYLDVHSARYDATYFVKSEEMFHVREGFPRIVEIPPGTGDLRYSLIVSAGASFKSDLNTYLNGFVGSK